MLTRYGVNTRRKYWSQIAFWMITWFWALMSLFVSKTREGSSCRKMLFGKRRDLLQVVNSSEILSEQRVCGTLGPFDEELSKMHEAEVHVFSDSVLCTGRGAMNEPDAKFTKKMEFLSRTKQGFSKKNWWRTPPMHVSHISRQRGERNSARDRWMDSTGLRRRWTAFCSSNSFHGNHVWHFFFCNTRKEMQLTSTSSNPDTSVTLVQVQKRLGNLRSISMRKGKLRWTGKTSYECVHSVLKHPILKENWRKVVKTCTSSPVNIL